MFKLWRSKRSGQAAIEFVIVFGLIVFVVLGAIEIGQKISALSLTNEAVRSAASIAAVSGGDYVASRAAAQAVIDSQGFVANRTIESFTLTCGGRTMPSNGSGTCRRYEAVRVSLRYREPFLVLPQLTYSFNGQSTRLAERDR